MLPVIVFGTFMPEENSPLGKEDLPRR